MLAQWLKYKIKRGEGTLRFGLLSVVGALGDAFSHRLKVLSHFITLQPLNVHRRPRMRILRILKHLENREFFYEFIYFVKFVKNRDFPVFHCFVCKLYFYLRTATNHCKLSM